ncbi:hypothetical protein D3C72_2208730 [compost metagenome]
MRFSPATPATRGSRKCLTIRRSASGLSMALASEKTTISASRVGITRFKACVLPRLSGACITRVPSTPPANSGVRSVDPSVTITTSSRSRG